MGSIEKLKKILHEWAEHKVPHLYTRDFDYSLLSNNEILSIIGARRTGKTYLCYQLVEYLKKTLPYDNIIYINFEDERLYPLKGDELTLLWDICPELFSIDYSKKIYLFIDEIQNAENWSKWARRITEQNKNLKLIITGSSSRLLSREISTELRGRTLSFTVFPLSFPEYLNACNIQYERKNILYSKQAPIIKKHFNNYFKSGGFPAVIESPQPEELLKEYFKVMFYRDLVERNSVKNIKLFEDYLTLLIDQTASCFSISQTAKKLSEFGYSFSKNTLSNFSKYAQDAFLLLETRKYSYKIKEQLRDPKKIYTIDHGLVKAIRFSFSDDTGKMLKNIAYIALRRKTDEIYYHKGKKECDFIITEKGKVVNAIQVSKILHEPKTRKREIEGLLEAINQYQLKEGLILTEDESGEIKEGNITIRIQPLWFWLLC